MLCVCFLHCTKATQKLILNAVSPTSLLVKDESNMIILSPTAAQYLYWHFILITILTCAKDELFM